MIRRIVVTRGHEFLRSAWANRSFAVAGLELEKQIKVRGVEFDSHYHPVRVPGKGKYTLTPARALGFNYGDLVNAQPEPNRPANYAIVAQFDDEEAVERLKADKKEEVAGVYVDL